MNDIYSIIRRPIQTEKSELSIDEYRQYTFEVAMSATKNDVKIAVEQLFNVTVEKVNTAIIRGKNSMSRGRRGNRSKRPNWKKATVRIAEGQGIDFLSIG